MGKQNLVLFGLIFFGLVLMSGCVDDQKLYRCPNGDIVDDYSDKCPFELPVGNPSVRYLGKFEINPRLNENKVQVMFRLMDENHRYVSSDALVDFNIITKKGKLLYGVTFNVKEKDFIPYTTILEREPFKAYSWDIPLNKIKKSDEINCIWRIRVTSQNSTFSWLNTTFKCPIRDEEIKQIYENRYLEKSTQVQQTKTKGCFKITLERGGFYTYYSWDEEKTMFRLDFKVTNVDSTKQSFHPSAVILDNKGNQFENAYGGTLHSGEIYPRVSKSGYVLFDVPTDELKEFKVIVEAGKDEKWKPYEYEYSVVLD